MQSRVNPTGNTASVKYNRNFVDNPINSIDKYLGNILFYAEFNLNNFKIHNI